MNRWLITSLVTLLSAYTYYCTKKRKIKKTTRKEDNTVDLWNTVMFFPDHFHTKPDSTTSQLIWYMDQATKTLDICMFAIQFRMIENKLVEIAKRGVAIRIISNYNCRIRRTPGITKRHKIHTVYSEFGCIADTMHHKFVIIDDFAIMTGSLNWTFASVTENRENVMVSTNPKFKQKFSLTFERLWTECGGPKELPWSCGG
ncbi:unnamed protein product [Orchesella dallaii]|uniref:Mitochondrial cardiolipin hydrolase n=1 Tax=Orchesella dallaii TaxID=48710 RepID=A0ABP1PYE6_9HEXA